MQVNVHSLQFKADSALVHFIESRLEKLKQFDHQIIGAEVFLKLDKNNELGNKTTEIKLLVPGKDHFAKRQSASFEASADLVIDALRRQIKKAKGKRSLVS